MFQKGKWADINALSAALVNRGRARERRDYKDDTFINVDVNAKNGYHIWVKSTFCCAHVQGHLKPSDFW